MIAKFRRTALAVLLAFWPCVALAQLPPGGPSVNNITGLGNGVGPALGVGVGSPGSFVINGGTLGTPSSGVGTNLTGLNAANLGSGIIPSARTNGHQAGTATNDNAAAGEIGEYISASVVVGSAVPLTTAVAANVTSISLTAGDWDVWGNVIYNPTGSTVITSAYGLINNVSATVPTAPNGGAFNGWVGNITGSGMALPTGSIRYSLSATTTIYLVAYSAFSASTNGAYGFIGARRAR